ncbi:hypothetical protein D522_06949 [Mycobacterium avium subsp. paratuberculosis S5]|nr:hypothetical protein D522_06949 [Mycobacterium avium subsp. paratuberculosis S5]
MTGQHGRHVEFGEAAAPVFDVARRNDLDALKQLSGFRAPVGLHHPGHQIRAALQPPMCLTQHGIRLAHPRGRTQIDA